MNQAAAITRTLREEDIAVLTFNEPEKKANILSKRVLDELDSHLNELAEMPLAGLLIHSEKPGIFIAGADLREFAVSLDMPAEETAAMCRRGRQLFQRLSQLPFITVAAIDGVCVGGGTELALWCDRRLVSNSSHTEVGLPEVKLGIFPGWGGTVRASRILGLANAVEMITSGQSLSPDEAVKMGFAEDQIAAEHLLSAACQLIRAEQKTKQFERDRKAWDQPIQLGETELAFLGATASALIQSQTKGQYPAPLTALEVLLEGSALSADEAGELESQQLAQLWGTPVNRALINVFFLSDRNKKDSGVENPTDQAVSEVRSVGVVGAGIMGSGIAAACVKRKLPVSILDAQQDALIRGTRHVLEEVAYNKQTKKADAERLTEFAPLVNATTLDAEVATSDLVIEAVVENADVKRQVLSRLEAAMPAEALLATNTSTIPIGRLAEGLAHPERFCGIHFFNPVRKMPLVEVIRGEKTSDETVLRAVAFAKAIRKSPIVVNDSPGFLVNRLLFPYMNESLQLLTEGVPLKLIERMAKQFGMPMGPITLYDVVGLDTALYAGKVMWEAFPDRIEASPLLLALVKAGRLGQKTGAGFFAYPDSKKGKGQPDPELDKFLEAYRKDAPTPDQETITARLFLPMLLEATRLLEEGIVRDVRDVDLGLIYGIGFPPFQGGLLFWADRLGTEKILAMLKPLESLGPRFQPTPLLDRMAREGKKFYQE